MGVSEDKRGDSEDRGSGVTDGGDDGSGDDDGGEDSEDTMDNVGVATILPPEEYVFYRCVVAHS